MPGNDADDQRGLDALTEHDQKRNEQATVPSGQPSFEARSTHRSSTSLKDIFNREQVSPS
jgi:hypothetical protein